MSADYSAFSQRREPFPSRFSWCPLLDPQMLLPSLPGQQRLFNYVLPGGSSPDGSRPWLICARLIDSRRQIRSQEGAVASPAAFSQELSVLEARAKAGDSRGQKRWWSSFPDPRLLPPTLPPSSFSWFALGQNANWGTQLQGTSTQMCGKLGLQLQSILGWSFAKGILSNPVSPHCPGSHPSLPREAPRPGSGAWVSNIGNMGQTHSELTL